MSSLHLRRFRGELLRKNHLERISSSLSSAYSTTSTTSFSSSSSLSLAFWQKKAIRKEEKEKERLEIFRKYRAIAESLESEIDPKRLLHEFTQSLTWLHEGHNQQQQQQQPSQILRDRLGFGLFRRPSSIPNSGQGLFVELTPASSSSSSIIEEIPALTFLTLYPGVVYQPGDPILLPSLSNSYIIRRSDGVCIDGKYKGLSKLMFRSASGRDHHGIIPTSDPSWLNSKAGTLQCENPLGLGHLINHGSGGSDVIVPQPNVMYFEFDIPFDFPLHLRRYIPNVPYQGTGQVNESGVLLKTIALITVRPVKNEELFSNYCFIGRPPPSSERFNT